MAVSRTPAQLAGRLNVFATRMVRGVEDWTKNACREITKAEIIITPFDTGKAKSNWVASLNSPRNVDRPPLAPGKSAEGPAISEALSVIRAYRFNDTFYLVNGLNYVVVDLNRFGKSEQADAGWFQRAFANAVSRARSAPLRIT